MMSSLGTSSNQTFRVDDGKGSLLLPFPSLPTEMKSNYPSTINRTALIETINGTIKTKDMKFWVVHFFKKETGFRTSEKSTTISIVASMSLNHFDHLDFYYASHCQTFDTGISSSSTACKVFKVRVRHVFA